MLRAVNFNHLKRYSNNITHRKLSYVQGQEPEPNTREYFYYIDHQGMEKKFLRFFFNQLKPNNTDRYNAEFPYLSRCGRERNFVRCDDCPFVFTHILEKASSTDKNEMYLAYNHADSLLTLKFQPDKILMLPETGRVYHPAPERAGSIGLIQSKLAIELSKFFHFGNGELNPPTTFTYMGEAHELDHSWYQGKHQGTILKK